MEYDTINDQETVSRDLENQYDKVTEVTAIEDLSGATVQLGLNTDTKGSITDERIAVEGNFEDQRVILGQIIEVDTPRTSSRLLAYQYYGSQDLGESITELNSIRDPAYVEGTVEIITQ